MGKSKSSDTIEILEKTNWSMGKPNGVNIIEGDQLIIGKPKSTEEVKVLVVKE